jgi:hypothetical protein
MTTIIVLVSIALLFYAWRDARRRRGAPTHFDGYGYVLGRVTEWQETALRASATVVFRGMEYEVKDWRRGVHVPIMPGYYRIDMSGAECGRIDILVDMNDDGTPQKFSGDISRVRRAGLLR